MATYQEHMQEIFQRYQREISPDPVSLEEVGAWAVQGMTWITSTASAPKKNRFS
jgi:hypothetical protein